MSEPLGKQTGIEGSSFGDHARIEITQYINSPRQSGSKNFDIPNNLGSRGLEFDQFLGREQDLENLHTKLAVQDTQKLQIALVTGMPGVGKSELMVQYGQRHLAEFTGGVGWFAAADFGQGVRNFVQDHFVEDSRDLRYGNDAAFQVQESWQEWHNFCGEYGSALILIDDVQNYQEQVQPYLEGLPRGRCPFQIVMTSRSQFQKGDNFGVLEIDQLCLEDGVRLFGFWAADNPSVVNNQPMVEELCGRLGCLPLALILTGSWLAEHERTLEGLILALGQEGISTKAFEPNSFDPRLKIKQGLDAAIAVSWRSISADAQQLGRVLSLFAAADLPWELVEGTIAAYGDRPTQAPARLNWWQRLWRWLCGCVGIKLPPMVNLAFFPITNPQEAKITLRRSSLLQSPQAKVYRLHLLLHEFMGQQWAETDREGWREAMLESLSDRAAEVPQEPTWEDAQNYQIFVPHFQHGRQEANLLYQQATTPDQKKFYRSQQNALDGGVYRLNIALIVETTFQNAKKAVNRAKAASKSGDQQAAAKLFAQAIEGYERAIDQAKQALPPNGMLLAGYLFKIAQAFRNLGKYNKGLALAAKAVSIAEAKANPVSLAKYLNMLAMLHVDQGNYSDAEPLYGRSLQIRETQLGADHPDTASSLNNLAGLYDIMGRYSEAEPLYGRSLQINETRLGTDHPDTARSLNNLAQLYKSMGRYSEAEPLYRRSLQINETQLGADHPDTASSLNNLAGLYDTMGRYSEAEPLYERSLQIRETQLGTDHPDTARSLNNLAALYCAMGRYSEAEPLYLRTLEIWMKSLGEDHPSTQTAWGNFRYLLQQALTHGSADSLSSHPLTQQLLQELRE